MKFGVTQLIALYGNEQLLGMPNAECSCKTGVSTYNTRGYSGNGIAKLIVFLSFSILTRPGFGVSSANAVTAVSVCFLSF